MKNRLYLTLIVGTLLCMVGWTAHGTITKKQPARQIWEYIIVQEGDGAPGAKQLNNLGPQGWELVSVVCTEASISPINLQIGGGGGGGGSDHCYYYLKRARYLTYVVQCSITHE